MRFQKELDFVRSVAMHAGDLAVGYQTQGLKHDSKPDLSPVTIADRECEKLIASRIDEIFPDDGILGEEGTRKESRSGRLWIIDPIDGTRDFVRGLPLWSQLIGLEVDGEVVVGVCSLPPRREMYYGVRGEGAWLNDQRISISGIDDASNALVCVSDPHRFPSSMGIAMYDWLKQFWAFRSLGGCLDAMMVASGKAEVWIVPEVKPWDLAPMKVILEEAGATFLNFDGRSSIYGGTCAAFVPPLEQPVRSLLVLS